MFDPTLIEAIVTGVLTLLGVGAGAGMRRGAGYSADLGQQLATFAEQQTANTTRLTEIVTTLDTLVLKHLERHDDQFKGLERAGGKLKGDVEDISDSVELLVSHLGDEHLPPSARQSIAAKLHHPRRHEVTGVITMGG